MNKSDAHNNMVFTLTETEDSPAAAEDWVQELHALRHQRQQAQETIALPDAVPHADGQPEHHNAPLNQPTPKSFNDAELDAAYRIYLEQMAAEHNRQTEDPLSTDIGILMQEDWLAAQAALKTEIVRHRAQKLQTLILQPNREQQPEHPLIAEPTPHETLPEFAVHVYELPELPPTRRVKILSEQDLIQGLRDKLTPHLTNAVAGMVRQVLQKKLATLSYELQIQFNEETPQLVQDVLEYHLDNAIRTVKHQLRQE